MKRRNQGIVICLMTLGLFALFDGCEKQPEYNWVKRITDYKPEVKQYWELEYDNRGRLTKLGNTPICYDGDEVKVGSLEWNSRNEKLSYATYRKMDDGVYTCLSECFVNEDSTSRNMLKETTFCSSGDTIHVLAYYKDVESGQVLKEVSSKYVYDDRRRLTDVMNCYLDAQGNETWACHSYYTYDSNIVYDANLDLSALVVDCDALDVSLYFLLGLGGNESFALPNYIRHCVNHGVATYQGEGLYRMTGDLLNKLEVVSDDLKLKARYEFEYYPSSE